MEFVHWSESEEKDRKHRRHLDTRQRRHEVARNKSTDTSKRRGYDHMRQFTQSAIRQDLENEGCPMLSLHQRLMVKGRTCRVHAINHGTRSVDIRDESTGKVETYSRRHLGALMRNGVIRFLYKRSNRK